MEAQSPLSDKQRARIERNRQRAILLRNARLTSHPYLSKNSDSSRKNEANSSGSSQAAGGTSGGTRLIDTGGGFLLDADEHSEAQKEINVVFEPGKLLGIREVYNYIYTVASYCTCSS